ncbi:IS6 family transposase [Roseibacterium sp. SDUM158017]|nr:IS6 family transposase [Roseibacterium sp. SDUM158017]MDG4648736.1 IS6 family transposase [Roseibacterium sp. SDUM158017]
MSNPSPFKWFKTSPEIIRLAVMMYVRFPLSLRNVEDLLHERAIDVSHETVRFWWHRFGPTFASEIRKRRIEGMKSSHWRWHLDEMFVKINGERHYLWRAVDHEGEVLESFVTKTRDKEAALKFLKKAMRRHGNSTPVALNKMEQKSNVRHCGRSLPPVPMTELRTNLPFAWDARTAGQWQASASGRGKTPVRPRLVRLRTMPRIPRARCCAETATRERGSRGSRTKAPTRPRA